MKTYFVKFASDPSNNSKDITFFRINVYEVKSAQDRYDIKIVPTFLTLQSRELMGQCQGVAPEDLQQIIVDLYPA